MPALNTLTITVEANGINGVVNVWNDLPYQTITYAGPLGSFRPATIVDQVFAAVAIAHVEVTSGGDLLRVHVPISQSQSPIDAVVAAHDASILGASEVEGTKANEAKTDADALFSGIGGLPSRDQITIAFSRALVLVEGGTLATALAIDTVAEANTARTSSAWWVGMAAAQKAEWGTFLQALRYLLQLLVYLIRR